MNRPLQYTLQRLTHLDGRDLFAAAVDELLDAARERQEPLIVQEALVSRVEPTACQATLTRQRTRGSSSSADPHAVSSHKAPVTPMHALQTPSAAHVAKPDRPHARGNKHAALRVP